jgi:nitrogen PTS system EIIA component
MSVLTTSELAERLRVSPATVRNWAARGEIPALRIARTWRFRESDIQAFFNK